MSEEFTRELQELQREIQELKDQLAGYEQRESRDKADINGQLMEQLEEVLRSTVNKVKKPAGKVGDYSKDIIEAGEKKIEENPLVSILIAFGLGWLASSLMERK